MDQKPDPWSDLLFFLFILLVLGIAWLVAGGPSRLSSGDPFLSPPPPLGTGETYTAPGGFLPFITGGGGGGESESVPKTPGATSPEAGHASLSIPSPYATEPNDEYLWLRAVGGSLNITGWRLKSAATGKEAVIGRGAALPYSAQVNIESDIVLRPGEEALITTGRSPIGVSFRLNKCTGYFEQFQDFTPPLRQECPAPREELTLIGPRNLSDFCINYIEGLPSCAMDIAPAVGLPPECVAFITEKINYNQCVANHKSDADFAGSEWRVFLGRTEELWKERRETIELYDRAGNLVTTITY